MNSDLVTKKKRQAVIVVDPSSHALYPLTADIPLCLLPLANMKVIDYSLYWLASQRVDEIIICCTKFEEEINDYLVNTNWNIENLTRSQTHTGRVKSPLIQLLHMPTCSSTGDILRELDSRGCIESDSFLLVDAGAISNLDLKTVWKEHEARQKKSSYNIMTSIFTHLPVEHDSPSAPELALIHNEDNRILAYSDIKDMNSFSVMTTSLLENKKVSTRFDIAQTGVHICSREVLVHFSDNYDYKDIYDDYLSKEVDNIEFGYCYYAYFHDNAYSRCITDLPSYRTISQDVICRWCFPMVPDNEIAGINVCQYTKNDIYRHQTVKLSYSTHLVKRCLVQYKSVLEEDVEMWSSTIGAHCTVQKGCTLDNCIIYDHCTIGNGCVLKHCIIGQNVVIGDHCILDHCILGNNVTINDNQSFNYVTIHNIPYDVDLEEEEIIQWNDEDSLEEKGEGEGYYMKNDCQQQCKCSVPINRWKVSSAGCQGFESDLDEDEVDNRDYERLNQSIEFVRRLEQSGGKDLDDIYTEISCFRMSLNCTYEDILNDLVTILIQTMWKEDDSVASFLERTADNRVTIRLHNSLIAKFLIGNITKMTIVEDVAKFAVNNDSFRGFFGYFIQQLWDENVVDINSIETWIGEVEEEDEVMSQLANDNVLKRALDDFNDSESSYDYSSSYSSDDSSEDSSESGNESESGSETESGSESESEGYSGSGSSGSSSGEESYSESEYSESE